MFKYVCCIIILYFSLSARANDVEIRYHVPQATEVTMIWGINEWNTVPIMPTGTWVKDKVMHSPMVKDGNDFVLKLQLPDSCTIDYLFEYAKTAGPFNTKFVYFDDNEQLENKFYHSRAINQSTIRVNPDPKMAKLITRISLLKYSTLFLLVFSSLALGLFAAKKLRPNNNQSPVNQTLIFFAIPITLLCILVVIRAIITGLAIQFLIAPWYTVPLLLKTSLQDFLYTCLLTLTFGVFFFIKRTQSYFTLWLFGSFAVLSILVCMVNIKITEMLGRPFTYQWLYYSDFLNSTDASSAIKSNIEKKTLLAYLLMCLAAAPLGWLIYQLMKKKPLLIFAITITFLVIGFFSKNDNAILAVKKENPVIYFLASLTQQNGLPILSVKKEHDLDEFRQKNKNIVLPKYAAKFSQANIKNVIVFVLESTPAEYVTTYNPRYQTTPFLDSIKSSSLIFDAIYSHAPATNKSLVSILCGSYPYLSYKSLTAEKPGIQWPSLSSELKKDGYRTSFINSGDNRFQGAENFLQHRGFNSIQDFRINPCDAKVFSDNRYVNENLEGIKDSCLAVKFFNWIGTDYSTPFFSMMWTYQTHYPYYSTGPQIDFQTNNPSKEKYLNGLHDADKSLQLLVEGLKKRDLLQSTLIVVLGDHGEAFGRHGQISHAGGIYEENLHIPLILINQQLFNGEHINSVGGTNDVAPTIFSILNKSIPAEWQGENLFSIYRRDRVYFFSPYSDLLFGCRKGNYKFIYNATSNASLLFDLETDPTESINIVDKHPEYVEETKKHLNAWMQYQTNYMNLQLK